MRPAQIIVGLGYGDEGKGGMVDYLARDPSFKKPPLVVRYNGGAQAGHNVVLPSGEHHTFSQLGSGSFVPGCETHLSHHMVFDPVAFDREWLAFRAIQKQFDIDRHFSIAPGALVVTRLHKAVNRIKELMAGEKAHGTTGRGIGEAFQSRGQPWELTVTDLSHSRANEVRAKLLLYLEHVKSQVPLHAAEVAAKEGQGPRAETLRNELCFMSEGGVARVTETTYGLCTYLRMVPTVVALSHAVAQDQHIIFEGAQGMLLDERCQPGPHVTWGDVSPGNALRLLGNAIGHWDVERIGVTRTYLTRHGAGPLIGEGQGIGVGVAKEPFNTDDGWQGKFRVAPLDMRKLKLAAEMAGIDWLSVTHANAMLNLESIEEKFSSKDMWLPPLRWVSGSPTYQRRMDLLLLGGL